VWVDVVEARSFADRADPTVCGSGVKPPAVGPDEDRPFAAFADGQVKAAASPRDERDGRRLVAFADGLQGPMSALEAEGSTLAPQASLRRRPLRPSRTARAACIGEVRSAV